MNMDAVRVRLREATDEAGSIARWAQIKNVPASVVSDVLNGRRDPTPQTLAALGIKRVTDYQFIEGEVAGE